MILVFPSVSFVYFLIILCCVLFHSLQPHHYLGNFTFFLVQVPVRNRYMFMSKLYPNSCIVPYKCQPVECQKNTLFSHEAGILVSIVLPFSLSVHQTNKTEEEWNGGGHIGSSHSDCVFIYDENFILDALFFRSGGKYHHFHNEN